MMTLQEILQKRTGRSLKDCNNEEIYYGLLEYVKELCKDRHKDFHGKKKVYYISAEFLIGKLLSNNLINLGKFEEVKSLLSENGKNLYDIEEVEPEPSLGNGGLGRLAACFLDSISNLGLCGDGMGLNYHFGLFKQEFHDNFQKEYANDWMRPESWLTDTGISYDIEFGNCKVKSKLYDIDVPGSDGTLNKLHLFDAVGVDDWMVEWGGINFDKKNIEKNLTLFLYPDDSDEAGRLLRLYQQYFMVSNSARYILEECKKKGSKLHDLYDYAAIQINDTHPSMVIPELIRLLMKENISMDEAIEIVTKTCAYTNHTILAEALEKWPVSYIEQVAPQLMPIIRELDRRVNDKFHNPQVAIIDGENRVHMAHMDIHYGHSVNGVAYLHTEILKNNELNDFYRIYPERFNNKTNGITFRRWLLHCNESLAGFIEEKIGAGFKRNAAELEGLLRYKDDEETLVRLMDIKRERKLILKDYLKNTQGIKVNENSIFDIQVKRLHEYKRQQMNALYAIYKYLEIKKGNRPRTPLTMVFGAKAAPAYTIAKDIIHLILCLQQLTANDPEVSPYLRVVMVENYNVSKAGKVIPAADISEQISLASKEASGTGNMKFMLNGAVTLGTMDGANVEIADLVGRENIYVFGESSSEVIEHYNRGDYDASAYYIEDARIRELVNFIISPELLRIGNKYCLLRLHAELIQKDWFMTLLDLEDYIRVKEQALADYGDRRQWAGKCLVNIAKSGFFSSDRTIEEYNRDIWRL